MSQGNEHFIWFSDVFFLKFFKNDLYQFILKSVIQMLLFLWNRVL